MSTFLDLSLVIDNSTKTVDVGAEGTLDWYCCGDRSSDQLGYARSETSIQVRRKKNVEAQLYRGFAWRINVSASVLNGQTVQRTIFASASDDNLGAGYSSNVKTGFFQLSGTAMYSTGYRMVLRALPWRTQRLRCYSTDWRCATAGTAKIYDGEVEEASEIVTNPGINGNSMHEWQVDFRGGSYRSWLVFEMAVTGAATGSDQNLGIQAFSLSVVP